jgi:hypothetical protein
MHFSFLGILSRFQRFLCFVAWIPRALPWAITLCAGGAFTSRAVGAITFRAAGAITFRAVGAITSRAVGAITSRAVGAIMFPKLIRCFEPIAVIKNLPQTSSAELTDRCYLHKGKTT